MRIIGLDPGLKNLGWGVIEIEGSRLRHISHGVIRSGEGALATRLTRLFNGLTAVIGETQPSDAAVEETFANMNPASTLKLGQARSVCLLVPGLNDLPVSEYAPNKIKKTIVGQGHATKDQVAHMISVLLSGVRPSDLDAVDALAIAICHAHHATTHQSKIAAAR
ncbi:MAG: crossover junction endodeoxyribonuclease RuvC [Pseudomonadota bacterium]